MQNVAIINERFLREHNERRQVLNEAVERLLNGVLGCWQHDLSRPFTHKGRTYRVCVKCGMSRKFDTSSFKTYGRYGVSSSPN
jgi:hypothetical protein